MNLVSLLLTLSVGCFILIGYILSAYSNNSKKLTDFSICMAFGVIIGLIVLDILPETFEILKESLNVFRSICLIIILSLIGIVILKILDLFVPCHEHEEHHTHIHKNDKCHEEHLHHIGIVSAIAIIIHNLIEGMSLYLVAKNDLISGLLLCIGIGLHNIPMGFVISSTLLSSKYTKNKVLCMNLIVSFSTFVGGLFMFILGGVNELIEGILLGITLGMLIYISIFELLHQIYHMKNKNIIKIGIIIGFILIIASFSIGHIINH